MILRIVLAMAVGLLATTSAVARQPEASPRRIIEPQWLQQPLAGDYAWAYPKEALAQKIDGQVLLDCEVNKLGRLGDCRSVIEVPEGHGFGQAARNVAGLYRMAAVLPDGSSPAGARVETPVHFDWRGRVGDPSISGAPDAAEAGPASPTVVAAGALAVLAAIIGFIWLVVRDGRHRDRDFRLGPVLGEAFRLIPVHWRAAPVPTVLTILLALPSVPAGSQNLFLRFGSGLLLSVAGLFMTASVLRLLLSARGHRLHDGPGLGGLHFGAVEGTVWMSGVLGGFVGIAAGLAWLLIAFISGLIDWPAAQLITWPILALLAAAVLLVLVRLSFLAPYSVVAGAVDVRGAWNFGLGKLGTIYLVSLVGGLMLFPTGIGAAVAAAAPGLWWLGGLIVGLGYAAYYSFIGAALGLIVLRETAPKPISPGPLGVIF